MPSLATALGLTEPWASTASSGVACGNAKLSASATAIMEYTIALFIYFSPFGILKLLPYLLMALAALAPGQVAAVVLPVNSHLHKINTSFRIKRTATRSNWVTH